MKCFLQIFNALPLVFYCPATASNAELCRRFLNRFSIYALRSVKACNCTGVLMLSQCVAPLTVQTDFLMCIAVFVCHYVSSKGCDSKGHCYIGDLVFCHLSNHKILMKLLKFCDSPTPDRELNLTL